jgi:hypothetical protein
VYRICVSVASFLGFKANNNVSATEVYRLLTSNTTKAAISLAVQIHASQNAAYAFITAPVRVTSPGNQNILGCFVLLESTQNITAGK